MPDVRMPDGTIIRNVPEGTTRAQLVAKLAPHPNMFASVPVIGPLLASLGQDRSPTAPSSNADMFIHDNSFGADVPAAGLANKVLHPLTPGSFQQGIDQRRASIASARSQHPVASGLSEAAGAITSAPAQIAQRGMAAVAPRLAKWAGGIIPSTIDAATWGAGVGRSEGKDPLTGALSSAAGNAAGNVAFQAASRVLSPVLARSAEQLASQGIDLTPYQKAVRTLHGYGVQMTPGQIAGAGPTRAIEDTFSTLPSLQKAAQRRSILSYNLAKVKDAVSPVGDLPAAIAGRDAIAKGREMVTNAYASALNGVTVPLSDGFHANLDNVVTGAARKLTPSQFKSFQNEIADNVTPFLEGDAIQGEGFQAIKQGLQGRIAKYSNSPAPADNHVANALKNYLGVVMDEFKTGAPDAYSLFKAADQAHANLTPIEDAALRNRGEGVVTPFQMAGPVHKVGYGRTRSNLAAGTAPGQSFVDAANMVLPPTMPSSFTTERGLIWKLMGLGGAGGGAAALGAAAPTAATVGTLSLPYIPPVARAYQAARLAPRGPVLDALARRLQLAAPAAGMAVAPLAIQQGQ